MSSVVKRLGIGADRVEVKSEKRKRHNSLRNKRKYEPFEPLSRDVFSCTGHFVPNWMFLLKTTARLGPDNFEGILYHFPRILPKMVVTNSLNDPVRVGAHMGPCGPI